MIVALALRLAARRLLADAKIADASVYDSAISGLDELIQDHPVPIIIVSTEDERANITGRDVLAGDRSLDLIVEVALGSAYSDKEVEGVDVPATDAGLELSINLIARQVTRALFQTQGATPWAKFFHRLAPQVRSIATRRGASATGTRFAARQIIFTVEPLAEPAFGAEPEGIWPEFLALVAGEPAFATMLPLIRAAIVGDPIEDWRLPSSALGLTDEEALGIGIFPLAGEEGDPMDRLSIDGVTLDSADVERNLPDA